MTKKEFAKLKVGDKILIKKYDSVQRDGYKWVPLMDRFIGKVCTIDYIFESSNYFTIKEDVYNHRFHYNTIDKVVVGAVATKHDNIEPAPEERIKQLEAEIKALKEEQKRSEDFEKMKKAGSEINAAIEGLMAGGLSREEAFELVKITCAKVMSKLSIK